MATTTTNYGWDIPQSTDLVKDGATAIATLGQDADTTVYNNAQAAINKTLVDAKGDLIVATAADTVSRLAVGTNDYVLTADSTADTGMAWKQAAGGAGNMVQIATGTLSGTSVSLTGLSSYTDLILLIENTSWNTGNNYLAVTLNSTTTNNYRYAGSWWYSGT